MTRNRILIVEDDDGLRQVIDTQLARDGHDVTSVGTAEEAIAVLDKSPQELVITDLNLPGLSGLELLKTIRLEHHETTAIVMTAYGTIQTAVDAMKQGAYDYVTKPVHPYELKTLVKRSLDHQRLQREVQALRSTLDRKFGFDDIIGSSPVLLEALDMAARIAVTDATVLISGETGTGKEMVARAIHSRSARGDRPFMTINCGAIPRELLESELFGYVKGAFTGALTHKKGKVEMADGGTVFLDEIGEMPLDLQVRILRLIQERELEKIGATNPTKVDVRIIAATHRDLAAMSKQGTFREDLYYRLLVVPIKVPPLRDRTGDVIELAQHFFARFRAKYSRGDLAISSEVLQCLAEYKWPGNVRELENVVERMVLLARTSELMTADLPDVLMPRATLAEPVATLEGSMLPAEPSGVSLEAVEKYYIIQALKRCGGNQAATARFLGISRRTLAYRLEKYGVQGEALKAFKHGAA
jgi:two-component system, NtrC family, response regulator